MSAAIELRGVEKSFGNVAIIRNINLSVAQGERHALIGPNGAGKSTTFNLISGYMAPSSGSVLLRGQVISGLPPYQINRRGLSRSFQVTNVFANMSVWENLRCAVLWATGHRYSFWKNIDNLPARRARGPPDLRRAARAGDRHYRRGRRRRHLAGRAYRRHESPRDRARGRVDPPPDRRPHADDR
jgi:ABC-type branched-subunit amino acid transport system ATPase component